MTGYGRASTTERVLVNNDGLVIQSLLKIQSDPLGNLRDSSFDGDEMNVFIPQSIQTQIELEEIADVKRQIISPSSSRTSIGLVQDGLVGAYNLTGPTVKIDWRNAMNIMSYTSFEDMRKFEKDKKYTGQEVFSLIIPPGININGDNNFQVKDSVLMPGSRLSKDVLGEKKKFALHQLIWDEYGTEQTKTFIDNAQKLVNNFNLYNGFSVGYGDACVDKSVKDNIDKYFITLNQKIDHMITELENNPDMMDKDVFEFKLQQEYGIVLDSVAKVVVASLPPTNSFYVMCDKGGSGSKGSLPNIGQIIGCLGLLAVEGKIAPKKYNNRTLAYFHQHDDRGASRGLVRESYIDGLSFPSFTFLLMAGREGIIDSALKSVTGDTPIIIMENNEIKRIKIGDWIDSHLDANKDSIEHHEQRQMELLNMKDGIYIPTTDFDGKVTWGAVTAITRHDPGNELYEIKTFGGRSVIVTESKSLLIWNDKTKQFAHTSTPEVKVGDCVPVTMNLANPPLIINEISLEKYFPKTEYLYGTDFNKAVKMLNDERLNKHSVSRGWWKENNGKDFTLPYDKAAKLTRVTSGRSNIGSIIDGCVYPFSTSRESKLEDTFKLNKDNGRFIGLFLAEGNVDIKSGYVGITNNNMTIINFVKEWFTKRSIKTHFETRENNIGGTTTMIRGYSRMLAVFLTKFVGHGARHKFVPAEAFNANEDFIKGLLDGYFSGDGCVYDNAVQVSSASYELIEGISNLLNRLGIFGKISKVQMKHNNLGTVDIAPSHVLAIRAQWAKIFSEKISLIDENKQKKLKVIRPSKTHMYYKSVNDVILDKITEINKIDVKKYPKVYDLTIPSTLNFGLANGLHVVDTADSGYAQRRLVKSEEDAMIKYDCSVRTANEMLLQLVYGDSGSDITKQYEYNVDMAKMSNEELKKRFLFTSDELKAYKDFKSSDNEKIFDMIKHMRDEFRVCMKKARCDFKSVITKVAFPLNFTRIIDNTVANKSLQKGELVDPLYVYNEIERILDNKYLNLIPMTESDRENKKSIKNMDEQVFKTFLKTALYNSLAPKKCCIEKKMTKLQFDTIIKTITTTYNRSVVQPGEMVGVMSAQALGEPLTQLTLNTFHAAGLKTMSSTLHGGARVKEILGVSKKIKTPQLLIQLIPEYATNKEMARKVASNLKYTTIGDIRGRINVYYEPEPDEANSIMKEDNVKNVYYSQKSSKNSCQSDYKGLPWLMRIEIVKEKMLEKEISLIDIKSKFCNWWEKRYIDSKLLKKEEKKVINKITNIAVLSNTDNDLQPVIHIRFNVKDVDKTRDPFNREMINEFIDQIIDKFKLKGIESISNIDDIAPEKFMVVDKETGELKQEEQYMIYTAGTNLVDIRYLVGIDIYNTISNDIVDVYKHFGIEIARTRLLRELYDAYDRAGQSVSYTNISVLIDIMTSNGILMSIDRHGMNKSDTDVLGRASFERAVDQILTAGVFGETDHMRGVSSRVMAGLVIKGGTGYCDVILDTNAIEKSEYSEETNKYRTHVEIITDAVAKDIMKNDTGDMFIPE